jgi:hypothetical protein
MCVLHRGCGHMSLNPLIFINTFVKWNLKEGHLHLEEGTLYCVIGLAYLEDPECYADGRVATGRVSLVGQDEGERSEKARYPDPPGCGLRRCTSTPSLGKKCFLAKNHTPKPRNQIWLKERKKIGRRRRTWKDGIYTAMSKRGLRVGEWNSQG